MKTSQNLYVLQRKNQSLHFFSITQGINNFKVEYFLSSCWFLLKVIFRFSCKKSVEKCKINKKSTVRITAKTPTKLWNNCISCYINNTISILFSSESISDAGDSYHSYLDNSSFLCKTSHTPGIEIEHAYL